jgi:carhohydrate kinase
MCAISLDVGTSSIKVAVIDIEGGILFHKRLFFTAILTASYLYSCFMHVLEEAICYCTTNDLYVLGISVSGNGPTLISVSKSGRNKDVLLMWNEEKNERLPDSISIFAPRLNLFKKKYKVSYENSLFFLPLVEYLLFRLGCKAITLLPEKRFEAFYWKETDLKAIEFDKNLLCPFVELGYKVGNYKNIPVFAGPPDYVAALIGTNTLHHFSACDVAGSSEGINISVKYEPINVPSNIRVMPSIIPDLWTVASLFADTGIKFSNAVKNIKYSFKSDDLEERFKEVMEVISTCYYLNKEMEEINIEFVEIYGIVMDILNSLKASFEALERITGFSGSYTLSGGHAKNELYINMKSFVTKRTFTLLNHADAELLGNAILVFYKSGVYSSLKDAAKQTIKITKIFKT